MSKYFSLVTPSGGPHQLEKNEEKQPILDCPLIQYTIKLTGTVSWMICRMVQNLTSPNQTKILNSWNIQVSCII